MLDRSASLIALFKHTRKKVLSDRLGRGGFATFKKTLAGTEHRKHRYQNTQTKPPQERSVAKPLGTDKASRPWQGHPPLALPQGIKPETVGSSHNPGGGQEPWELMTYTFPGLLSPGGRSPWDMERQGPCCPLSPGAARGAGRDRRSHRSGQGLLGQQLRQVKELSPLRGRNGPAVPGYRDRVPLTVPSAGLPPAKARQETTVSAGAQQAGRRPWGLPGAALVSDRMDGPPTAARALKPLQIRDLSLWAGEQNPTLLTLLTENKYE